VLKVESQEKRPGWFGNICPTMAIFGVKAWIQRRSSKIDKDRQRMTEIDEVRLRLPKILTARCVMLANITAFGRPASGSLTRLRLDESAGARRKGEG